MSIPRHHAEWLSLVEQTGPFLSMPVLLKRFNTGLEAHDPERFRTLRMAYEEWEDKWSNPVIHNAWVKHVLGNVLELTEEVLAEGQAVPQSLAVTIPEHAESLRPDFVVRETNGGNNRMLIRAYPATQHLEKPVAGRTWKASPSTRMMELLHGTGVRLGLVTNGEHWMLVDAPRGETTGFASWYAHLWLDEPITLRAFRSLLSAERFFGVPDDETLEAMLAESALNQQEVTDQLGYQVRNAVEILVRSLDRADQDHGRKLLEGVSEPALYEAALTVMMRLVFLFCAEERKLLPDDEFYTANYSVSSLSKQLRETSDQYGEEILERRHDAWCRLLSTFRAVHGGVSHDRFNLPAYGGNLFDPDRFPFLEGRRQLPSPSGRGAGGEGTWRDMPADPLPVGNRTVLHLLEALQLLEMRVPGGGGAEKRRLSFIALDIEQIGHVYEGLLDHTAKRAPEPVLGLAGAKNKEPEIPLSKLEAEWERGEDRLLAFVKKDTGRSESALGKGLNVELEPADANRFQAACGGDAKLWERVRPFAGLVRDDTFGRPVVIPKGSVYVTAGTDRRTSGTHYTPKSLTEPIVQYTLEPLVYEGPAEGKPKEQWRLRSPRELLELNICDMACGSGAFLVQACRYLSERLMEAWEEAERSLSPGERAGVRGSTQIRITPYGEPSSGEPGEMLIPKDTDERIIYAPRIVAGRCLYGVDINPLACEMAKLSLWLLTLAKDMPFTFLDHAIRCGDSLVGISDIKQLEWFSLSPPATPHTQPTFAHEQIRRRLNATRLLRRQIEERFDGTVEDTEHKALMLKNADEQTRRLAYAADHLIAVHWQPVSEAERERERSDTLRDVEFKFKDLPVEELDRETAERLRVVGCGRTFHWPLEFPEVFERGGFDAVVGNPPFMGGQMISGNLGAAYRAFVVGVVAQGLRGSADLCAYFFLRGVAVLRQPGDLGLLATNTIAQGDTYEVGLDQIDASGDARIVRAVPSRTWPGSASLEVAQVWLRRGHWVASCTLNEVTVPGITPSLKPLQGTGGKPHQLAANLATSYQGCLVLGMGFVLAKEEADALSADPKNRQVLLPYLNGDDLNSRMDQSARRWIICFYDWPLERGAGGSWHAEPKSQQREWLKSGKVPDDYPNPVAADFPECLAIVEQRVRAERLENKDKGARKYWWRFLRPRLELYHTIANRKQVLVVARTAKYRGFCFVPARQVLDANLVVFVIRGWQLFACLQCTLHEAWVNEYSSTLETRQGYRPSDCFENYPLPENIHDERPLSSSVAIASVVGKNYYRHRQTVMLDRQEGITAVYNRFHDPDEASADIQKLRELHVEMDNAVAAAYGWTDLDLGHGFHDTKQGVRYTISEPARREVLQRLLKLNHERYEEEVRQGLHEKKGKAKSKATGRARSRKKKPAAGQETLFDNDDDEGQPAPATVSGGTYEAQDHCCPRVPFAQIGPGGDSGDDSATLRREVLHRRHAGRVAGPEPEGPAGSVSPAGGGKRPAPP